MYFQWTGPGPSGIPGPPVPSPVEEDCSRESDCVMSRSLVTEAGTVGRTSVRAETVTQTLVSIKYFIRTFITLFDRKRLAVKSIDLEIEREF